MTGTRAERSSTDGEARVIRLEHDAARCGVRACGRTHERRQVDRAPQVGSCGVATGLGVAHPTSDACHESVAVAEQHDLLVRPDRRHVEQQLRVVARGHALRADREARERLDAARRVDRGTGLDRRHGGDVVEVDGDDRTGVVGGERDRHTLACGLGEGDGCRRRKLPGLRGLGILQRGAKAVALGLEVEVGGRLLRLREDLAVVRGERRRRELQHAARPDRRRAHRRWRARGRGSAPTARG